MSKSVKQLQHETRVFILNAIYNAQSSHIGSALSCIDLLIAQKNFIKKTEKIDEIESMERIVLSKGHGAAAFYALLSAVGASIDYKDYYQNDSWLTGHISHKVKGVIHSTGSLGHGLPVTCGMAFANKNKRYSVLLSDGEMQEGSNWEALMVAPQLKLKNISIIIDYNNQQSFGKVTDTMSIDPLEKKLEAFGWHVEIGDGHDIDFVTKTLEHSLQVNKPLALIANTVKGKGVSFMENRTKWHYSPPNHEEYKEAMDEINTKYAVK